MLGNGSECRVIYWRDFEVDRCAFFRGEVQRKVTGNSRGWVVLWDGQTEDHTRDGERRAGYGKGVRCKSYREGDV